MAKICLRKKCYNFGTKEKIFMKSIYDNFKASNYVMQNFLVRTLNTFEKYTVKERYDRVVPGRDGPVHHGYSFYI